MLLGSCGRYGGDRCLGLTPRTIVMIASSIKGPTAQVERPGRRTSRFRLRLLGLLGKQPMKFANLILWSRHAEFIPLLSAAQGENVIVLSTISFLLQFIAPRMAHDLVNPIAARRRAISNGRQAGLFMKRITTL